MTAVTQGEIRPGHTVPARNTGLPVTLPAGSASHQLWALPASSPRTSDQRKPRPRRRHSRARGGPVCPRQVHANPRPGNQAAAPRGEQLPLRSGPSAGRRALVRSQKSQVRP